MAIAKDKNGCISWTLGRIADVTNLVAHDRFRYSFSGVNKTKIFSAFNSLEDFNPILRTREIEILNYIGLGLSSQQIGEILFISRHTVDTHRRNILKKLAARGCIEAYIKAKDMGLF